MMNICVQILGLSYCTEKECIYTSNQHMLSLCAKKSGAGWMGGWKSQFKDCLQQSKIQCELLTKNNKPSAAGLWVLATELLL